MLMFLKGSPAVAAREPQVQAMLAGEGVRDDQPVAEQQRFAAQQEVGEGGRHARLHAALAVQNLEPSFGPGQKLGTPFECLSQKERFTFVVA